MVLREQLGPGMGDQAIVAINDESPAQDLFYMNMQNMQNMLSFKYAEYVINITNMQNMQNRSNIQNMQYID